MKGEDRMKIYTRRALSLVLAIALLITCGISGLVLPTSADTSTFKLSQDKLYIAPATSYVSYVAVNALNLDGTPYTAETITWTSGDTSKLAYADQAKGIFKTVKDATGKVTITATNASGESHSCEVTLAFDGEIISGGDFETLACQTGLSSDRWKNIIKSGVGEVVVDPDDPTNHVLKMPVKDSDTYYNGLRVEVGKSYVLEFDLKGDTGEIMPLFIHTSYTTGKNTHWQYLTPEKDKWTHYSFTFTTKNPATGDFNCNYVLNFTNKNTTSNANTNPVYFDNVTLYELGTAESVELSDTELELDVNGEATLTTTFAPAGATNNRIFWTSSDDTVAKVENGKVTGLKEGHATITMTSGLLTATCEVTVGTSAPVVENLLPNGDIEQGKVKPWTDGKWVIEEETNGNTVLKIPAGTAYNAAIYWKGMEALDWEVGYYLVSFDAKGDEVIFMTTNTTNITTTSVRTLSHGVSEDSNDRWTRYYSVVQLKDGYTINSDWAFHFKTYRGDAAASQADTYIDNVSVTKLDPAALNKAEEDFDGDVLDGYIYKGLVTEIAKKTGGAIVDDPDDADNKVFMIPQDDEAQIVRFKFQHPGSAFFDLTGLFKYTIRYKGALKDEEAANSTFLSRETTEENGWTTLEKVFDPNNNESNDLQWSLGLKTSTTGPIYIDYISLEEISGVTSIELDKTEATLEIDDTLELNATTLPEGAFAAGTIEWSSDETSVATVTDGVVTAVGAGTAIITAKLGDLTATCEVTVSAPAPVVENLLPNGDFEQGGTGWSTNAAVTIGDGLGKDGTKGMMITTTVNEGDGSKYPGVYYTGDFISLLKPNTTYVFSFDYKHEGKGWGDIDVIAAGSDWTGNWKDITQLTATEWTKYEVEFTTGSQENITEAVSKGWEWYVRHVQYDNAANNNGSGTVWYDNFSLMEKTVVDVTSIELNKTTATLEIGDTLELNATTLPEDAFVSGEVQWFSDKTDVATVENGVVTAVGAGTAIITAQLGSLTATCTVTVTMPVIPDTTGIKLDKTTATVRVGKTVTLTASALPNGAVLPTVAWTSDNEEVATVADGVVTAVKEGIATITATAEGLTPVTCTVNVIAATDPDELFPNGDFEGFGESEVVTAPWQNFVTAETPENKVVGTVTAGVGVDGSYGLKMGSKNSYGSIVLNNSEFELEPNSTYRFSFWSTSASTKNAVRVNINKWNNCKLVSPSGASMYTAQVDLYDGWFVHYVDFTTGDIADGIPSIHGNGGLIIERLKTDGKPIYMDNFSLKKIDDTAEVMLGGDPDTVADLAFTELMYEDRVTIVNAPTESNANNKAYRVWITADSYFKNMHLAADFVYKVSFDYKGGQVVLGAPTNKGLSLTAEEKGTVTAPESDEWAHFETTLNVPASVSGSDRGNWALNFYRSTTQGVLVDNFSIVKTEKPETAEVKLNKTELSLGTDSSDTLTATFKPAVSKYESISWTSDNEAVATVDQTGKVTATNTTGTATITISVKVNAETTLTAQCVVTVKEPVESFSIVQDKLHLASPVGNTNAFDTVKLNLQPKDAYTGGLIWTSDNTEVATVENGKVKALKEGTATITVTNGTVTDTIEVVVDQLGERITGGDFEGDDWNVAYWTTYIIKEGNGKLVADPKDANNTVLVFDKKVSSALWMWPAQVNPGATYKLTFKAMSPSGKARMYLCPPSIPVGGGWIEKTVGKEEWTEVSYIFTTNVLNDGTAAALNRNYTFGFGNDSDFPVYIDDVSLVQLPPATDLSIDDATVTVRGTTALKVNTVPAEATTGALTWKSSDESIIKVNANGVVSAIAGEGKVTITVENADGTLTDSAEVEITGDYITAIEMNRARLTVPKLGKLQLETTTTPLNGRFKKFVWESSDNTIATVDENGLVTATDKPGTVSIKVTSGDLSAECTVVVLPAATQFEFAKDEIVLAPNRGTQSVYKTPELKTEPAEAFVENAQWTSSDPNVVEIDHNGKMKALAKGTATITLTNGTITDTMVVKVDDLGERITGGTFEGEDWNTEKFWTNGIIKHGSGSLVTDPTDISNTVLSIPAQMQPKWMWPAHVNAGKTYKITFRAMGGGGKAYINFSTPSVPTGNGWKNVAIKEDAWTTVSFTFTTNALDNGTAAALNRNYTFGFCSQSDKVLYIDDVSMVELPPATDLKIVGGDSMKLYPGNSSALALITEPAEASVGVLTWTSSDPNVVSVDANGKVTAVADSGSATITVTNPDGLTDTFKVEVDLYANLLDNGDFEKGGLNWASHADIVDGVGRDGGKGLVLSKVNDVFYKGSLNVLPSTTYILSWDYLATKDAEFRVWAGSFGLASHGSFKDSTAGQWVTQTKVFTTPVNMKDINSSVNLGWIFSVVSDKVGTFSPTIVDNISIKVYDSGVLADSIKLNYETMTLLPGRTQNLGIFPMPTDANINFSKWTSSNEDVATVENGIVTAIGKGVATITATTANGKSASCVVTVSGEPAFILNGTFEAKTNKAWKTGKDAEIVAGVGVNNSKGGSINGAGKLSQSFKGLKPETTYELFIRYRSAKSTNLGINLLNGTTDLLDKGVRSQEANASWTSKKIEFKTGKTLKDTTTLELSLLSGTGPVFVDYIFIAQKAELVDLIVSDVIWDGGDEQVKPGTELLFAVTVKNQGTDSIKAGSAMMIDICMDSKPVLSFPYTFATEFTGGSTAIVMADKPWAAVEGDHVISARVNSTLSILEMDTTNNNRVQNDLRVNDVFLEAPEIAEKAGFTKLGFSDDFNSLDTIDTKATGADGYKWYVTRPYGASSAKEDDYSIENGIITLKWDVPTFNYGFGTTDMKTDLGFQYRFGYMETRIRIPRPRANQSGEDGIPAIWSLPQSKLTQNGKRWVEMDWLEYWGINGLGSNRPEGYYTITLHDQEVDDNDQQILYNKNRNYSLSGLGDGEWHKMAWLWMEDMLVAYVDDVEVWRLTYDEDDISSAGGALGAFSWMNHQDLPIHIHGSRDNPMEMDYIRIWTGLTGGNKDEFVEEETPDEDDIIIDMAAEEFWYNYCTDDWGDNITEVTYDNYLNVLGYTVLDNGMYEAEYYWSKLSDERKAEINALLAANGQPTYDELLAAALAMAEKVAGGWLPPTEDGEGEGGWQPEDQTPEDQTPEQDLPEDVTSESDEPEDVTSESDEPEDVTSESDEPEDTTPEDNTPTGATTVLPMVAALALLVSLAALLFVRKRDRS